MEIFTESAYNEMIDGLFKRFPSFQKSGASAYKPGIGNMLFFDGLLGHPHRKYMTVHVAGTNGKGSVSNMLASVLAGAGLKVGLYTSPHILDFRERMRVADGRKGSGKIPVNLIDREKVWDFVQKWGETFDHLDLSFFEITTAMAFDWFAAEGVDAAVIETGLGGRLDSTNIISPILSVITNIGLDHCDLLGGTLAEIAFEKAGIIKPLVPVVVGESNPETDPVFERKVLYSNLPEPKFMGDKNRIMSLLSIADKTEPPLWDRADEILAAMDLQGTYQRKNLRTVLTAADVLSHLEFFPEIRHGKCSPEVFRSRLSLLGPESLVHAIEHTASIMDFHGRWEKLCDSPYIIADIGHNSHGLKYNFAQLAQMMAGEDFDSLTVIYGAMADKDVDVIMRFLPPEAEYVFVTAPGKRAMKAEDILKTFAGAGGDVSRASAYCSVREALSAVLNRGREVAGTEICGAGGVGRHGTCKGADRRLIYIGGSTYVVSEALAVLGSGGFDINRC